MTTTGTCVQCGQELRDKAKFCGQCGAVVERPAAMAPADPPAARTLFQGGSSPQATRPQPETAPSAVSAKRTMMGFSPAQPKEPARPAPAEATVRTMNRTMLGIPNVAPTAPGPPGPSEPKAPPAAVGHKTMLGVAIAGMGPLRSGDASPERPAAPQAARPDALLPREVAIVPPPAPLTDLPAPPKPRIVRKGGVPLAAVALVTGALVVVGGLA